MIRLSRPEALSAIAAVYNAIFDQEEARPISFTNWQRGKYPTVDYARQALEAGTLYTGEEAGQRAQKDLQEYALSETTAQSKALGSRIFPLFGLGAALACAV